MARSLNKVTLIGNLTRDPELRYTPQGNAVCTFSIATNRQWKTDTGDQKDDVEYHRIVAWNKLAEICSQFLTKGRKTYVEGRLQTRDWETKEGEKRTTTEIVANEMIILDSRGAPSTGSQASGGYDIPDSAIDQMEEESVSQKKVQKPSPKQKPKATNKADEDDGDIPF